MSAPGPGRGRPDGAALVIAALLGGLAVIVFWQTRAMPVQRAVRQGRADDAALRDGGLPGAARDRPRLRGLPPRACRSATPTGSAPMLWIVGGLVLQMLLLKPAGFAIATGLLFAFTARGFGKRAAVVHRAARHRRLAGDLADLRRPPQPLAARRAARAPLSLRTRHHGHLRAPRPRPRRRAAADEPALRPDRRHPRHRRRRAPRHRPGADRGAAAAGHLPVRPDGEPDHVRRHLLRRHVRRLDDLDPAQHPRRERLDRHRARGQQDGAQGPRRAGARHRRDRLLRRRADRDDRPRLHLARGWSSSPSRSGRPTTSR